MGRCSGFGEGGDIPRLFSDRMPARIACRQVSENNRTFPPLKKGGQGGFLFSTFPLSPPLPDKSSPSPRFLWPDEIPPAPFTKGGGVRGLAKGGGVRGLAKGEIFRGYFRIACRKGSHAGKDRMPERIACRKGSHAGKFPKTTEHSPL
jgi:hypothetical protein